MPFPQSPAKWASCGGRSGPDRHPRRTRRAMAVACKIETGSESPVRVAGRNSFPAQPTPARKKGLGPFLELVHSLPARHRIPQPGTRRRAGPPASRPDVANLGRRTGRPGPGPRSRVAARRPSEACRAGAWVRPSRPPPSPPTTDIGRDRRTQQATERRRLRLTRTACCPSTLAGWAPSVVAGPGRLQRFPVRVTAIVEALLAAAMAVTRMEESLP